MWATPLPTHLPVPRRGKDGPCVAPLLGCCLNLTQLHILLAAQEEQLAMVSMPAVWYNEPSPSPLRHDHVRRYAHSAGDDPLPWDSAPARL